MEACFWIIGINTNRPAVAVDLHNDDGDLTCGTQTFELKTTNGARCMAEARQLIKTYAAGNGVEKITYDPDSTQAFAND